MSLPAPDHGPEAAGRAPLRLAAPGEEQPGLEQSHEHALRSLLQLSAEMTGSLSLYDTVDLLMFNLMGQFRVARAAMWLIGMDPPAPVLLRCRGFREQAANAIEATCAKPLREHFAQNPEPVLTWGLKDRLDPSSLQLLERLGAVVFAPVMAPNEILGWIVLGPRFDGAAYTADDLEILRASLALAGASIQNSNLYSRVHEANRSLRMSNDRLKELDALKSNFLANISHELRTPLAGIIGALGCVTMPEPDTNGNGEMVDIALQSANRLQHLLENLLMFADMKNDRMPFEIVEEDVARVVGMCYRSRLPGVNAGLRELTFEAPAGPVRARFDVACLGHILDELIDNAVKFTNRGSHVRLGLALFEADGRAWVRVDVTDDGPGIPETKLQLMFGMFEQVDGSSTRRAGGLGMGLAVSKELAERMGSRITVNSTPGRGTTFTVWLPAV